MNLTKTTFGAFALTTTILLGACGNNICIKTIRWIRKLK